MELAAIFPQPLMIGGTLLAAYRTLACDMPVHGIVVGSIDEHTVAEKWPTGKGAVAIKLVDQTANTRQTQRFSLRLLLLILILILIATPL